jgi:single-strand DNA-binding protein
MLNKAFLIGRLVADPEHRQTQSGKGVANLRVAVDRKGREKETDFFDVTAWGQSADFACTYLSKGRLVAVEGRIQVRQYTDKDNAQRKVWEIVADSIQPLDSGKAKAEGGYQQPASHSPSAGATEEIEDPFA